MSSLGVLGFALTAIVVVLLVAFYLWVYRRNRAHGYGGLSVVSRLTCPKCGKTFDHRYVPGASLSALRLGRSRYMECPLCHQWSVFPMSSTVVPGGGAGGSEEHHDAPHRSGG